MRLRSVLLLFALAVCANAQSPSKILSNANKALGGEKALKGVTAWHQTGRITRLSDGAAGSYLASAARGDLYAYAFDLNGFEVAAGYNGKSGWRRDSRDGLRTLTGNAARDFQAEAVYRNVRWLRAKDEKARTTFGGTADVDGKRANVVALTTAKGSRIRLFFDQVSGLPIREEVARDGGMAIFDYSDYRPAASKRHLRSSSTRTASYMLFVSMRSLITSPSPAPRSIFRGCRANPCPIFRLC